MAGKTVQSIPERFKVVCIPCKALYKCSALVAETTSACVQFMNRCWLYYTNHCCTWQCKSCCNVCILYLPCVRKHDSTVTVMQCNHAKNQRISRALYFTAKSEENYSQNSTSTANKQHPTIRPTSTWSLNNFFINTPYLTYNSTSLLQ